MKLQTACLLAFAVMPAAKAPAQVPPGPGVAVTHSPFYCNLKAFQPEERKRWRQLIEALHAATVTVRELPDGYSLRLDPRRMSFSAAAEWIALERKCCPFFDFELDLHSHDGAVWLALKGREGVKQFILSDFTGLQDKLAKDAK